MTNERLRADAAMMMDALREQLTGFAEVQRRRMALTGTASVCDKRIHVTVNAAGLLVDTRFADDIGDLTFDEIAAAMTQAVQAAAADVERQAHDLMRPLQEHKARLPKLSDLVEGAPDLDAPAPSTLPVPPLDGSADPLRTRSVVADQDW